MKTNPTNSHCTLNPRRAALMAALTKIVVVLFQLSLAATVFHKALGSFERDTIAGDVHLETGADDASAARGDPKWLALARVPLPPLLFAVRVGALQAGPSHDGSRSSSSVSEGAAWA